MRGFRLLSYLQYFCVVCLSLIKRRGHLFSGKVDTQSGVDSLWFLAKNCTSLDYC